MSDLTQYRNFIGRTGQPKKEVKPEVSFMDKTIDVLTKPRETASYQVVEHIPQQFKEGYEEFSKGNSLTGMTKIGLGISEALFTPVTVPLALANDMITMGGELSGQEKVAEKTTGLIDAFFQLPSQGFRGLMDLSLSGLEEAGITRQQVKDLMVMSAQSQGLLPRDISPEDAEKFIDSQMEVGDMASTLAVFGGLGKMLKGKPKIKDVKPTEVISEPLQTPKVQEVPKGFERVRTLEERLPTTKPFEEVKPLSKKLEVKTGIEERTSEKTGKKYYYDNDTKKLSSKKKFEGQNKPTTVAETLTPKEVLTNTEKYPTPVAVKEASELLGDKFEPEYQKFREENKPIKGQDPVFEEGRILEDFSRKTIAADKMGIDIKSDVVGEANKVKVKEPKIDEPKPIDKHITETPRNKLPSDISNKIKEQAEQKLGEIKNAVVESQGRFARQENVGGGYETTRITKPFMVSDFPEWFSRLGKSKKDIVNALEKIIEDKGKDKGKLVEDVKSIIYEHLTQGEELSTLIGQSGKFERVKRGEVPPDAEVLDFVNRFKEDVSKSDLQKAFKEYEAETSFEFGANVKAGEQISFESLAKAKMPEKAITGKGKGEETTPLFQQKQELKGQTNLLKEIAEKELPPTENATILRLREEALRKEATDELNNLSSTAIFNPKNYVRSIEWGGRLLKEGVTKFADWSQRMIKDLGEAVKPHLLRIWQGIKNLGKEFAETTVDKLGSLIESKFNPARPLKLTPEQISKGMSKYTNIKEQPRQVKNEIVKEITEVESAPIFEQNLSNLPERHFKSLGTYVRGQGKSGEILVDKIDRVSRNSSQIAQEYELKMRDSLKKISDTEFQEFAQLADKGGDSKNPRVQNLLNDWRGIAKDIKETAEGLGMEMSYFDTKNKKFKQIPFKGLENFFPHMWDFDKIKSGERYQKIIRNIAESNNISLADAKLAFDVFIKRNKESKYGNIDRVRQFNMPDWRTDKGVLTDYIERATKRIEEFKEYGRRYSNIKELLADMSKEGKDFGTARLLFDRVTGRDRYAEDWVSLSAKVNDWQVATKLTLLSTLNWTQLGNAGLVSGGRAFARSLLNLAKPGEWQRMKAFGESTGATINNVLKEYRAELESDLGVAHKVMKYTGTLAEERFLRILSSNIIADATKRELGSYLKNPNSRLKDRMERRIKALNLGNQIKIDEVINRKGFTEKELKDIGFEGARKTQFLSRPQDMPQLLSNKNLKLFTLFKSFISQQTKLVNDAVIKEVRRGNMRPLLFLATVFPVFGEIARTLRDTITGNDEELQKSLIFGGGWKNFQTFLGRYIDDIATVGALGILYDITKNAARDPEGLMSWAVGASVSDISKLGYGIAQATEGNLKPLGTFGAGQIPIPIVQQLFKNAIKAKTNNTRGQRR